MLGCDARQLYNTRTVSTRPALIGRITDSTVRTVLIVRVGAADCQEPFSVCVINKGKGISLHFTLLDTMLRKRIIFDRIVGRFWVVYRIPELSKIEAVLGNDRRSGDVFGDQK